MPPHYKERLKLWPSSLGHSIATRSLLLVRGLGLPKPEVNLASSLIGSQESSPKAGRKLGRALRHRQSCLGKTVIRPASICDEKFGVRKAAVST